MTDKSRAVELDSVPITATGHRRYLKRKAQAIIRDLEAKLAAKDRRIEDLELDLRMMTEARDAALHRKAEERARADNAEDEREWPAHLRRRDW